MIEAVIFDMDGVVIDSVEPSHQARIKVLKEYGVDLDAIPDPHNQKHKGASLPIVLNAVKQHKDIELDHKELSVKVRKAIFKELEDKKVAVDTSLLDLLKELKSHGIPLAIVTSATKESTFRKLSMLDLESFFQVIITQLEVKKHKPHPESYLTAIKKLNVSPSKSIVFEDSAAGVEAARAAGCKVIGFTAYSSQKSLPGTILTIVSWQNISYEQLTKAI